MAVPTEQQDWPPRCVAHKASFRLQAKVATADPFNPLLLTIEPAELMRWALTAAEYDSGFLAELQQRLAEIQHQPTGS